MAVSNLLRIFRPKKSTSSRPASTERRPEPQASPSTAMSCRIRSRTELRKVFSKFDANGDGKISSAEIGSMLLALGSTADPAELVGAADTDGDGYIQFEEFAAVMQGETDEERCMEELMWAFAVYDRDGDGVITARELQRVMREVMGEMSTTMADCRRMIRAVDVNGDGALSFDEFLRMMARAGR